MGEEGGALGDDEVFEAVPAHFDFDLEDFEVGIIKFRGCDVALGCESEVWFRGVDLGVS